MLQPPDIGVAYIIASMKKAGHEVTYFDLNTELYDKIDEADKNQLIYSSASVLHHEGGKIFTKYIALAVDAIDRVLKCKPDIVGFNVWQMNREVSLEFAARIKNAAPSVKIIFGGPEMYPLLSGNQYAKEDVVDLVVYGEAEEILVKVLEGFKRVGEFPPSPGTLRRIDGRVFDGGFGEVPQNLDKLPLPDLTDFPLDLYMNGALPISFTRGCVHKCEYCSVKMYPHFRSRSAANIVNEIEYRAKTLPGKNKYFVCDHALNANYGLINQLCDEIIERGIKAAFAGFAYTHPGADINYLKKMKRAGFNELIYGVESGSNNILNAFGKKINIETIERVIKDTYDAGIDIFVDVLVGLPGETEEDFKQTLDFIERNSKYVKKVGVNHFGVRAYSAIYENREIYALVPDAVISERIDRLMPVLEKYALPETIKARQEKSREGAAER